MTFLCITSLKSLSHVQYCEGCIRTVFGMLMKGLKTRGDNLEKITIIGLRRASRCLGPLSMWPVILTWKVGLPTWIKKWESGLQFLLIANHSAVPPKGVDLFSFPIINSACLCSLGIELLKHAAVQPFDITLSQMLSTSSYTIWNQFLHTW